MAITNVARAKSLAFTAVGGGVTGPISSIQNYSFSHSKELAEFLLDTSRVKSHWAGTETAAITIETANIAKWAGFIVGQKYTSVVLTIEGAIDSAGTSAGDDITVTLSSAVVTEVGELSMPNDNSAPAVGSVTFTLSRHSGASEDPTFTIASGA